MIFSTFNLIRVFRCHSLENDYEDDYSQIFEMQFEPLSNNKDNINRCVIVGQDYLNILNCKTGKLESRFKCPHSDNKFDELYAVCWSKVHYKEDEQKKTNIIAAAGGDASGEIILWDISVPAFNKPRVRSRKICDFKTPTADAEIIQMAYTASLEALIVGTVHGIYLWINMLDDKKTSIIKNNNPLKLIISRYLDNHKETTNDPFTYDRVCLISNELLAITNMTDHQIYVVNLLINNNIKHYTQNTVEKRTVAILDGPPDKGHFNKLVSSYSPLIQNHSTYLAIGNDKGDAWIWDLSKLVDEYTEIGGRGRHSKLQTIPVTHVLKWNSDIDIVNHSHTPLPKFQSLPKLINCLAVSPNLKYIVEGFNSNLVALWQRE